jgi:group I intron endonuclease
MPESTREERLDVEDRWIKIHFDKGKQCYNLCDRAISREGSGSKNPQETSRKISLARSGAKHHQFGKPLTKEWKQKLSNSKIGRIHSPETKAKMISAKQNARKPRISMPVKQISDTGEVLGMFDSLTQAAKAVHGQIGPISLCLKGKLKTAYGFVWELSSI